MPDDAFSSPGTAGGYLWLGSTLTYWRAGASHTRRYRTSARCGILIAWRSSAEPCS